MYVYGSILPVNCIHTVDYQSLHDTTKISTADNNSNTEIILITGTHIYFNLSKIQVNKYIIYYFSQHIQVGTSYVQFVSVIKNIRSEYIMFSS